MRLWSIPPRCSTLINTYALPVRTAGPPGSSSGSAVSVAAGLFSFSPLALGTELDASIVMPAARAGLYAIKLTPKSVDNSLAGFQPSAPQWDSQGLCGRTTADIANIFAILQRYKPDYYRPLPISWDGLRVGFVDPALWRSYPSAMEQIDGYVEQTDAALFDAQVKIEQHGGSPLSRANFGKLIGSFRRRQSKRPRSGPRHHHHSGAIRTQLQGFPARCF